MFSDKSFSTKSFSTKSWYMGVIAAVISVVYSVFVSVREATLVERTRAGVTNVVARIAEQAERTRMVLGSVTHTQPVVQSSVRVVNQATLAPASASTGERNVRVREDNAAVALRGSDKPLTARPTGEAARISHKPAATRV